MKKRATKIKTITDTHRLDWCARNLMEVTTLHNSRIGRQLVEISYQLDPKGDRLSKIGVETSVVKAFRDALKQAMRKSHAKKRT